MPNESQMISPFTTYQIPEFIPVDQWIPNEEDMVFRTVKGVIFTDVSRYYGIEPSNINLDSFILTNKRSYNNPKIREHCTHYLNYFCKFYDREYELLIIYYKMKYLIDYEPAYTKENFLYDLNRYFMEGPISIKLDYMNEANYSIHLTYENKRNPSLQYSDRHAKLLMKISITMNAMIPLICHYMYRNNILNTTDFLLEVYDILMHKSTYIDIYSKIYETSKSNVDRNSKRNAGIWKLQDIRGINETIHAIQCCQNILINIIPKYVYSEDLIKFNYASIKRNTGYQVLDIEYECNFIKLSSSNRDEDNNSEFDKYESFLIKQDESLFLQSQVAAKDTMELIEMMYGPFDDLDFYKEALMYGGKCIINSFQKELVFNLFYKYFGDPSSINCINLDDYIKLVIASKRILESNGLIILPYIISSRIIRLTSRKNISKRELTKIESSPLYSQIKDKYKNDKIEKHIISIIGSILTSEFQIIDPEDEDLNGCQLEIVPELVCEEVLRYITLI